MRLIKTVAVALLVVSPANAQLTELSRTPLPKAFMGAYDVDLVVYRGGDPPAGVEVADTVPAGVLWDGILSTRFQLVTAATPTAVRWVRISLKANDGTILTEGVAAKGQAEDLTRDYQASNYGHVDIPNQAPGDAILFSFPNLVHGPGGIVGTRTENLDGADDFGAPIYVVREIDVP